MKKIRTAIHQLTRMMEPGCDPRLRMALHNLIMMDDQIVAGEDVDNKLDHVLERSKDDK
jgi:hypothetical protein